MTPSTLPPVRLAGLLSLITLAAGIWGEFFVLGEIFVPGSPAETARHIVEDEALFRLGFAAILVDYACYVGVSVILYALLKPIGAIAALFALAASIIATAIVVVNTLFLYAPLAVLESNVADAVTLSSMSLHLRDVGVDLGLLFFGLHLAFVGVVVAKAKFLPRILGWLSVLGGLGFIVNTAAEVVSPRTADMIVPYILLPGILAQASLALWLVVMGVNAAKWREQAGVAA